MPTKFEVERAVIASALPSSAKLVILTIGIWCDGETGAIPPECRKSLNDITDATGLHKATVCRHLDLLEDLGWLQRRRSNGGRNIRTGYRLLIGTVAPRDSNVVPINVARRDTTSTAKTRRESVAQCDRKPEKRVTGATRNNHSVQVVEGSVGPRNATARPDTARGTRLPEDWKPSPELLDWAYDRYPGVDADDQTERFRDYWHDKAGAAARHVKWDLTWKNWIRRANDQLPDTAPPEAGRWD